MSTLQVEVVKVDSVNKHPNADRLDLVSIRGWQVVSQKGAFKAGDYCVYFPIDSVLPPVVEAQIFGRDSKVKLTKSRVKTIKLRGAISQGLITDFNTLGLDRLDLQEGDDLTDQLGVTKYEPPVSSFQPSVGKSTKKQVNKNFRKYTEIENYKNYNKLFAPDDEVVISEKLHGTNFRCGYVPYDANSLWKKIKQFLKLSPKYEFVFGSHNVQLQNKFLYEGFYETNVYALTVIQQTLEEKLFEGEVVYGEIYGPNIQKGYHYGKKEGEYGFAAFDVMLNGEWLDHNEMVVFCHLRGIPIVPILYKGPLKEVNINEFVDGPSKLFPDQKVREGVVIKSLKEQQSYIGRKILKCINPEYLLGDQTEFH